MTGEAGEGRGLGVGLSKHLLDTSGKKKMYSAKINFFKPTVRRVIEI